MAPLNATSPLPSLFFVHFAVRAPGARARLLSLAARQSQFTVGRCYARDQSVAFVVFFGGHGFSFDAMSSSSFSDSMSSDAVSNGSLSEKWSRPFEVEATEHDERVRSIHVLRGMRVNHKSQQTRLPC